MYMHGRKAGYEVERLHLGTPPPELQHLGEVAWVELETHTRVDVLGEVNEEQETSRTCYSLQGEGPLLWAEETRTENGHVTVTHVRPSAGGLSVQVGAEKPRQVPLPKDTLRNWLGFETWVRQPDRQAGDHYQAWQTDWELEPVDVPLNVTFRRPGRFVFQGRAVEAFEVDMILQGMQMTGQVSALLLPLKMHAGNSMELLAEPVSQGRNLGRIARWSDWGIPVDRPVEEARQLQSLTLLALGDAELQLPSSERQQVCRTPTGWEITLRQDTAPAEEPLSAQRRQQYLASDRACRCTKAMRELALREAPAQLPPRQRIERLCAWTFGALKKSSTHQAQTAEAVWDHREGDCTEHSLLLVALARAAGLPARYATGCMYAGGDPPFFGWHEWVEIYDGHRWLSVDPTWNQVGVDVTHVKFGEDPHDMSALNCIGRLTFRVKEPSPRGMRTSL